jgi:hypothetical protein
MTFKRYPTMLKGFLCFSLEQFNLRNISHANLKKVIIANIFRYILYIFKHILCFVKQKERKKEKKVEF